MELPILHRRITTSDPSNGPDCFSTCAGLSPPPSPLNINNPHRHVSNLFIAAACLIAAFFFLALTYYAVFNRRRRRRRPFFESQPPDGDDFVEADADHHIWHIRTLGLDEATIASIAICEFKASIGARDCSVCLADFADGELVRLLPKCAHAFHVQCIDTWLRAHVNCPICRSLVTAPGEEFGSVGVRDNSPLGTQESDTNAAVLTEGEEVEALSDSLLLLVSDVEEGGDKRIRRSVSMVDLPHCGSLPIGDSENSFREEESELCSKNGEKQGSSSKEVEKSGSGRGFFFSKSRRTQSLVLPL